MTKLLEYVAVVSSSTDEVSIAPLDLVAVVSDDVTSIPLDDGRGASVTVVHGSSDAVVSIDAPSALLLLLVLLLTMEEPVSTGATCVVMSSDHVWVVS